MKELLDLYHKLTLELLKCTDHRKPDLLDRIQFIEKLILHREEVE